MAMPQPEGMPAPAPEGAGAGTDVRPMLIKVLKKVMETASSAGIDFNELITEAQGGGAEPEMAGPRSPSPAAMGGM